MLHRIVKNMTIPKGWLDYQSVGNIIDGTRFIAFKVPLKEACVKQNLPPKEWFTPNILLTQLQDEGKELGLIIDLTNTTKYYNKNEFLSRSVQYEKIFTEGHVVPKYQVIKRFKDVVNGFLKNNSDSDSLIGVHCTHGLNRTGYIICRYMIDCLNKEPEAAIEAFNEARGHPIERQNYLQALRFGADSVDESEMYQTSYEDRYSRNQHYRGYDQDYGQGYYQGHSQGYNNGYNSARPRKYDRQDYRSNNRPSPRGYKNERNFSSYHSQQRQSDNAYVAAGWSTPSYNNRRGSNYPYHSSGSRHNNDRSSGWSRH